VLGILFVFVFVFVFGMGRGGVCGIGSWMGRGRGGVISCTELDLQGG
jgi:hypothetical protein